MVEISMIIDKKRSLFSKPSSKYLFYIFRLDSIIGQLKYALFPKMKFIIVLNLNMSPNKGIEYMTQTQMF